MLEMQANMGANSSLEELYPQVSIAILMRIIRDPSLSQHHTMVVQAITFIFKSLQMKCVPYVQQVIPAYLSVIRSADNNFKEVSVQQAGGSWWGFRRKIVGAWVSAVLLIYAQ